MTTISRDADIAGFFHYRKIQEVIHRPSGGSRRFHIVDMVVQHVLFRGTQAAYE